MSNTGSRGTGSPETGPAPRGTGTAESAGIPTTIPGRYPSWPAASPVRYGSDAPHLPTETGPEALLGAALLEEAGDDAAARARAPRPRALWALVAVLAVLLAILLVLVAVRLSSGAGAAGASGTVIALHASSLSPALFP